MSPNAKLMVCRVNTHYCRYLMCLSVLLPNANDLLSVWNSHYTRSSMTMVKG